MGTVTPLAAHPGAKATMDYMNEQLSALEQSTAVQALASYVEASFTEAQSHRRSTGVEEQMHRGLRAVLSEYDPEDRELVGEVDIYIGLTNVKVRALQSWLTDILANAEDKPWTLKPTPIPELPAIDREAVVQQLAQEVMAQGLTDRSQIVELARQMKAAQLKHARKLARDASERMEGKMEDHLLQGGWREAFSAFLVDLSIYPAAVIKAPVLMQKKSLRWVDGEAVPVTEVVYGVKRVSPFDCYPAPSATTPQDGAYFIERARMTPDQLHASRSMPGFSPAAIDALLAGYPNGYEDGRLVDSEREQNEGKATGLNTAGNRTETLYDTIIYYGKLPGSMLMEHGIVVDNHLRQYEAEVWVSAGKVLRCILNPHPLGRRPFYATSFDPVPGSFWGRSLPALLRDTQRMVNASARALARNMAFSSAPVAEMDTSRLVDEEDVSKIDPYRVYQTTSDSVVQNNRPVIQFHQIPDSAPSLLRVQEYYSKLADDVSGIPAYVIGNPNVAGAGRTLGGLSLLMGNAAKGVKKVVSNIDHDVVEPLVQSLFELIMMFDPDMSIKADAKVVARGSSGILQRELSQARAVETLQMLTPYVQLGIVPPEGLQVLLRQIMQSLGYSDMDIVPDPERQAQLARQAQMAAIQAQLAQSQGGGGAVQAPAAPGAIDFRAQPPSGNQVQLDNRSAVPPPPGAADAVPFQG